MRGPVKKFREKVGRAGRWGTRLREVGAFGVNEISGGGVQSGNAGGLVDGAEESECTR